MGELFRDSCDRTLKEKRGGGVLDYISGRKQGDLISASRATFC